MSESHWSCRRLKSVHARERCLVPGAEKRPDSELFTNTCLSKQQRKRFRSLVFSALLNAGLVLSVQLK